MKVKELIATLKRYDPEYTVIIKRDTSQPGYGEIAWIEVGVFLLTEYGNDFLWEEGMILNDKETHAICLVVAPDENSLNEPILPKNELS